MFGSKEKVKKPCPASESTKKIRDGSKKLNNYLDELLKQKEQEKEKANSWFHDENQDKVSEG